MTTLRYPLAALLLLMATACGNAAAAPVQTAAVAAHAPESIRILDRLAQRADTAVPEVTGLSAAQARARLRSAGLDPQLLALQRKAKRVHAQWPAAGEPRPSDGAVTVWLGVPPTPPPPPPVPPVAAAAPVVEQPVKTTAGGQAPALITPDPATQPGGRTPGLENFVAPPHPPRANIRTLPAAEPGTRLQGRASWYGPGFAGHTTACGGVFDPAQLTLASRELRCGTRVLVTGPGGSVEATVTDWGPAEWTNRRFDLSQATMGAVAGLGAGVVDVTVEVR